MRNGHCLAAILAIVGLSTSIAWSQLEPAPALLPAPAVTVTPAPPTPVPARGRAGRGVPMAPAPAQPVEMTTAAPALPVAAAPLDPFAKDLLAHLNSADAGQRSDAEAQLKSITGLWQQPEILQKMVDATADPELKGALQDRLNEVKAHLAMLDMSHLPNISLRVSGVNMTDLVTALNKALGTPNAITTTAGNGGSFSLDITDKPFWEVFAALSQQQPLNLVYTGIGTANAGNMRVQSGGVIVRNFATSGPVFAYFNTLNYSRSISLQNPNGTGQVSTSLSAQLLIAVDPRIQVARLTNSGPLVITDDTGRKLNANMNIPSSGSNVSNMSMSFNLPEIVGKTMSIECDVQVGAAAGITTVTIDDLESNVGKQVSAGGRNVSVSRFTNSGTSISFQVNANDPGGGGISGQRTSVAILDASGRQVWSGTVSGGLSTSFSATTGPYKLEIHAASKIVDIPVHLSFKDIPLP